MNIQGWAEIVFTIGLAVGLGWPLGIYMARVWQGQSTWLDPVFKPVERGIYAASGVDPNKGQGWLGYTIAMLAFNAAGFVALYAILRLQNVLPLNPQGFAGMNPHLAFNTAISFVTNTNWQFYSGESATGHLAQMAGFTMQNFASPVTAMAIAAALARAFAANRGEAIGNFWADIVRNALYILLPLSIITALVLVALGVPQTLAAHVDAHTIEGAKQTIALGPVASQEAIKQLGTNGGGFFGANSAHPFENPSSLTDLIEIVAMLVVGFACAVAFGIVAGARRDGRALLIAMIILVGAGAAGVYAAETAPTLPAATTAAARCAHDSAGGRYAELQTITNRSIRSGALAASHIPTMPPNETPA